MIGDDHLRDETGDAEQQRIEQCRSADGETQGFAHGREVGRDVDSVGNHQQQDERIEHERRKLALDVAGKPTARLPADAGADDLDRHHEWEREEHGPGERIAELRTRPRVGCNPARVVVRRPRNQPWPERLPEFAQEAGRRLLFLHVSEYPCSRAVTRVAAFALQGD